ncbi:MAG TPA: hypothetical protein PK557_02960 [Paludibacteraceae bacterium]|nr:hypothetical protein [Paludibacteraceae bacterium]
MSIYDRIIANNGYVLQKIVAIEELSELQKELTKDLRGNANDEHIAEEMADVEIMLEQLKIMYGNDEEVKRYKELKISRII